jgi:F1F0 ATPase subunit 2
MNDTVMLALAGAAGMGLGAMFFGGLWWTVRKGASSTKPALWFIGSLLVRMSAAMAGLYVIGRGHWERIVVCLVGFLMARLVVTWLTRPTGEHHTSPAQEASHAP